MSGFWTTMAAVGGPVGAVLGGWYAARATRAAAVIGAEAQKRVAETAAGPEGRLADLAVLRASVERVDQENARLRERLFGLESLVRAFAGYAAQLAAQLGAHGVEPVPPPERVDEFHRTGV
ncbi:hypothetical protein [Streptomyces hoynatensis]|uniref:Uncharacterized protein n=1 Tax=Streptomyces hoynatensis TaxID=1141874 RepID=A0A3A9Z6J5_9ACTN|nr:hypothetical protein [Streptomyces hoynatensis]RKN43981.1 hypothetical protein D7294_09885 [Streptomyces hoynatensis]